METIDGIVDIETDVAKKLCSFKTKPGTEYQTQLTEFAKINSHLAEFEIQ